MFIKSLGMVLLVSSLLGCASSSVNESNADKIKTVTSGIAGTPSSFWSGLFVRTYGVLSPDAPEMAKRLEADMAAKGYKIHDHAGDKSRGEDLVIIRDYRGTAAGYVPQTSEVGSRGGLGSALVSLGIGIAIGKNMGVVNTHNPLMSNPNTVANLVVRTSEAYGDPGLADKRASDAATMKNEPNLVALRLCFRNQCGYAVSAGDASHDDLENACYRDGILKLAGLK